MFSWADYMLFSSAKVPTPQMIVGLLKTAIYGDLSGYFFGNFRDKASNII